MCAGQHEQSRQRFLWVSGEIGRRPAELLQILPTKRRFDAFEFGDPTGRTDDLNPAGVFAGIDPLDFVEGVVAVDLDPERV
jgi:hypothetical protein